MKNITSIILTLTLFSSINVLKAQTKINEGKLIMEFQFPDSVSEKEKNLLPFTGNPMTIYFKNGNMRTEIQGKMGTMIIFQNTNSGEFVTCADMMGNKIAMKTSKVSMEKMKSMLPIGKPDIKYSDETKMISGVKCNRATVTYKDTIYPTLDVWYTKELDVANSSENTIDGIDGFLMESTALKDGIIIGSKITSFEKVSVPDSLFKIPEGYKMMDMDSLMTPTKKDK
jgi:hypothetical protein